MFKEVYSIRLSCNVKAQLDKVAEAEERTVSWLINRAVKEFLARREENQVAEKRGS